MELDALGRAQVQHLGQVPGDRLALPVWVGGEDDLTRILLDRRAELGDRLLAVVDHLVVGLEALLHVHPELLFGQVADVPHRGKDVETVTQEPLQSPRLGGALDDDQTFRHSSSFIPKTAFVFPWGWFWARNPTPVLLLGAMPLRSRRHAGGQPPPAPTKSCGQAPRPPAARLSARARRRSRPWLPRDG